MSGLIVSLCVFIPLTYTLNAFRARAVVTQIPYFMLKNKKVQANVFGFFIFNIRFLFLMGSTFLFSYTFWLFCFISAFKYFLFFPRKDCCKQVHKYSYCFILHLQGLEFYILVCDMLTNTPNVINPQTHTAIKQYIRSKHKYFALGMIT